jgi:ABC-2 type transport system permease protein
MLRFYIEVARTAFRRQLIYRWANLAGLLTNAFFGSVFSYVIIALYHARPVVAGYNVSDTLRYTWLVQSMIMVVLPFGWLDLMQTIRSGEVVADMSKPCDFYWYWFSREIGRDIYYLLFRCIPTYICGMLLFGIGLPTGWHTWLAYSLTFPLGAMIGIAYRFLYNVSAFWIIEAQAVATLALVVALFFTGSYVPLPFFPPGLLMLANWLPFNGLMNLPAELLVGKLTGGSVLFEIGRQILWLIVLTLFVRAVTARAGRRIISQGG